MPTRLLGLVLIVAVLVGLSGAGFAQSEAVTIIFDGNGAYLDESGQTFSVEKVYSDRMIDPADFPIAYLEERLFLGWFLDPEGELPYSTYPEAVTELRLYAKFREPEYRALAPYSQLQSNDPTGDDFEFHYRPLIGQTRYQTAHLVSQYLYERSDSVILATGTMFADALAVGPLASALDAPILLTPSHSLLPDTLAEIKRLGATEVLLIGATNAISQSVEDELVSQGLMITRIGGVDRFQTAVLINQYLRELVPASSTAYLVFHDAFPDALSIAGYAGETSSPILYSYSDLLGHWTRNYLIEQAITDVVIVGGRVLPQVSQELSSLGITVRTLAGADRYETNRLVNETFYPQNRGVVLAKGFDFPDALVAGQFGVKRATATVLVRETGFDEEQKSYIKTYTGDNNYQIGGISGFDPVKQLRRPIIRILLDPGHGAYANASPVVSGYYEGHQVFYLAMALKNYLQSTYDYVEVATTRQVVTDDPDLPVRGMMGEGYDLFFSLHTNALPGYPGKRGSLIFDMAIQPYLEENPDPAKPNPELARRLVAASAALMGHPNEGVKYAYWNMVRGNVPGNEAFWSDSPAGFAGFWNEYGVMRNSRAKHAMLIEMGYHTNYNDATFFMYNIESMARTLGDTLALYYELPRQ